MSCETKLGLFLSISNLSCKECSSNGKYPKRSDKNERAGDGLGVCLASLSCDQGGVEPLQGVTQYGVVCGAPVPAARISLHPDVLKPLFLQTQPPCRAPGMG